MHLFCNRVYFLAIMATAMLACTKKNENIDPVDLKKSYFPLKLKARIIYQVDSTAYSNFSNSATLYTFEIKDSTISQITETNRLAYLINRYKRLPGDVWAYQKSFTRILVDQRAEEFIDNVRYVHFTFPPTAKGAWNGNTYNNLGMQTYTYTDVDVSQAINGIKLDSTASVKQIDETNLVREDYGLEVYAKNVGLVKKEVRAIDKDIATGKILRGYKYLMQVKSIL